MKTKRLQRIFSTVLVSAMVVISISACGGNSNSSEVTATQQTASEKASDSTGAVSESTAAVDKMGKYSPAIELTIAGSVSDSLLKNIETSGMTMEKNVWTDLIEEKLGIKLKYKWIAKSDDEAKQKMDLAMASGDLPDLMNVDQLKLKQLSDGDQIEDMGQAYKDYSSELLNSIIYSLGDDVFMSSTFDGKVRGIPSVIGAEDLTNSHIWLREDWMKKLGLSDPKSMDELIKVLEAFTTQDPDGNGKKDTYGLALAKGLWGYAMCLEGFFNGYHAYPTIWVDDGTGKLVYGGTQPASLEALKKLRELYKAGVIEKEFGVKPADKAAENLVNGKCGATFGAPWIPTWPLNQGRAQDKNQQWKPVHLVSVDEKQVNIQMESGISGFTAVRKGFKNPEAIVKLYNLYCDKIYGENAEIEKYGNPPGEGTWEVWRLSPVAQLLPGKNFKYTQEIAEALKTKDTSKLVPEAKNLYNKIVSFNNGNDGDWAWERVFGPNGSYANMGSYYDNKQWLKNKFLGAPTKSMQTKWSTLKTMQDETYLKIILGGEDSEFDSFITNWNKLGGEKITSEVNEWYKSSK